MEYCEIMPGVRLRAIKTDKFKTGCISVSFINRISHQTASVNALIPRILCRGSAKYPDMSALNEVCDNLYGLRIEPMVRKLGDLQMTGVVCDCIDGAYTDAGESLIEECIKLLSEVLFNPRVENGAFYYEYVSNEARNLKDEIRSEINEKLSFAFQRTIKTVFSDSGYGVDVNGTIEEIDRITPESCYKRYLDMLDSAPVEIFFCGNTDVSRVKNAITDAFSLLKKTERKAVKLALPPKTEVDSECVEYIDMNQAVLVLCLDSGVTFMSEGFYAMRVLSAVIGGGTASKLFSNVREKKSLCYYTSARYDRCTGMFYLYSGISPENIDKARGEMLKQVDACANGEITEEELNNAKRFILNQMRTLVDSQYLMENYWLTETLCDNDLDIYSTMKKIENVGVSDVIRLAENCTVKLTYLLTGKEDKANERKYISAN